MHGGAVTSQRQSEDAGQPQTQRAEPAAYDVDMPIQMASPPDSTMYDMALQTSPRRLLHISAQQQQAKRAGTVEIAEGTSRSSGFKNEWQTGPKGDGAQRKGYSSASNRFSKARMMQSYLATTAGANTTVSP